MRHGVKFIILIMVVSLGGIFVRAASLSTSISGNNSIDIGSEITLTFFLDVDESVKLLTAKLNVDLSLLDIVGSPTALNGLNVQLDENNVITVSSSEGVSGSISFMKMTFKAKETLSADSQTIVSLSDVSGILFESDDAVSGSGSSNLITAVAPKSNNNLLSDLYTNEGDIGFSRNTLVYSLTVDNDVSRIRIVAKAENEKATVREDAIYNLAVYQNAIDIVVTAENGVKRTYTINVIRKDVLGNTKLMSSNAELKSLAIDGYEIEYSASVVEYRLTVGNIVDNVLVYAEASDPKSSVIIDNLPLLKLGENRVQVTVVAENGQSKIYTIFVTRSLEAPVIDLEDLDEFVYQTTATVLPILLNDSRWLSASVLDKVRRAAKVLDISKLDDQGMLLYRWTIDGRSVTAGTSIDLNIRFDSMYMDQME
ncbi:MAG: cadherin-like beta sandwich domain-containing protein, partial [Erysipelotrichaceae bacterium]|nr:cadherin-like beta sandwich domain-containing protein [Erysipelotrichaceae bacterium]